MPFGYRRVRPGMGAGPQPFGMWATKLSAYTSWIDRVSPVLQMSCKRSISTRFSCLVIVRLLLDGAELTPAAEDPTKPQLPFARETSRQGAFTVCVLSCAGSVRFERRDGVAEVLFEFGLRPEDKLANGRMQAIGADHQIESAFAAVL